jgi:hypothetical protein
MEKLIQGTMHHYITDTSVITNKKTNRQLKLYRSKVGYIVVDIFENNKRTKYYLHRLLAIHFIPNPENKREINHKDGNKLNNSFDNIEWVTPSENRLHAYSTELTKGTPRKTSNAELQIILNKFLAGITITQLAKEAKVGLSRLSIHLKQYAISIGYENEYIAALTYQKKLRNITTKRKTYKVDMCNKNTQEFIKNFSSLQEAAKFLGKATSGPISNVLNDKQKSAYGYFWKYS